MPSGAESDRLPFVDDFVSIFSYRSFFLVILPEKGRPGWPIHEEEHTYLLIKGSQNIHL